MTVRILEGNCADLLETLPAGLVHAVVTSPPYWGLRDYGTPPVPWPAVSYSPMPGVPACIEVPAMACSLGLEPTLEAFIGHMVLIFQRVRRVLADDGTCWVNMGDSYAGSRRGGDSGSSTLHTAQPAHSMVASRRRDDEPVPRSDVRVPGLKPKDLVGQPWRLAFALQADGWWLRQDVIWNKPNPMPESTKDRCTKAHEYLFLLAKSERYYFNQDALKEPTADDTAARYERARNGGKWAETSPNGNVQTIARSFDHMKKPVAGWASGAGSHSAIEHAQEGEGERKLLRRTAGNVNPPKGQAAYENGDEFHRTKGGLLDYATRTREDPPALRNRRSVWTIPTEPFKDAHFATFPTDLIRPCILASCPPGGTVADIFGGSGTTGLVADQEQRNAILFELNPTYIEIEKRRLLGDAPLLTELSHEPVPGSPAAARA